MLDTILAIAWNDIARIKARGRTVTLKLRYSDFATKTRSRTLPGWVTGQGEFAAVGHALLEELMPLALPVRLLGITLSSLEGDKAEALPKGADAQLQLL